MYRGFHGKLFAKLAIFPETGEAQANAALSENRAKAVCQYLAGKGVAPEHLIAKGYGESKPVAGNDTEAGRKKNRRVECKVLDNTRQ